MEYMEVPVFPGEASCSDNECPCGFPGAAIPPGTGYMYVSEDVVEFRRDAPSMREAEQKINGMQEATGTRLIGTAGVFAPILMCELGARKRGLDLDVAAADARHWWEHGEVPLRATPLRSDRPSPSPGAPPATAEPVEAHAHARHDGAFGLTLTDEHRTAVDRVVARATEQANGLRKRATTRWWLVTASYLLALGLPILLGATGVGSGGLLLVLAFLLLAAAVGVTLWVVRINRAASTAIADEELAQINAEGIPRWPVVEALHDRLKGSATDSALLAAIDPTAARMLDLRQQGLSALDAVAAGVVPVKIKIQFNSSTGKVQSAEVQGEKNAAAFRTLALGYLGAGAPSEALAALAVATASYGRIAPPGMREALAIHAGIESLHLQSEVDFELGEGGKVEVVGGSLAQGAQGDIVRRAYDVFSGFTYDAEARSILASMDRRRDLSITESLSLVAKGGGEDAAAQLAAALQEGEVPATLDPTFIGACVDHLNNLSPPAVRVLGLNQMHWIPDRSVIPAIFELFELVPFYPAGIDSLVRFGAGIAPEVDRRLATTPNANARFNLAIALGILGYEAARPTVTKVLDESSNPLELLGCHYALARWGDEGHVAELVAGLDASDGEIRHAAAICIEHLPLDIADDAFLSHLDDSNALVRLRLTRRLGKQGTQDTRLVKMLVGLLADDNEAVRSATVEVVGALPFELVGDMVLEIAGPGHEVDERAAAVHVLGKLDAPGVDETLLGYATDRIHPVKVREAALDALGERGTIAAVDSLVAILTGTTEEGREHARIALIQIGARNPAALLSALPEKRDNHLDGVRAVLGDVEAKERVGRQLGRWRSVDPPTLVPLLTTVQMVSDPVIEKHLSGMLAYAHPENFPGDRYVGHLAFKALVQSTIRTAPKS